MTRAGGGAESVQFRTLAMAEVAGTLGHFTVVYEGELRVEQNGNWTFDGDVRFYDAWDFDPRPLGERSVPAEAQTRLMDLADIAGGTSFEIRSDVIHGVHLSNEQHVFVLPTDSHSDRRHRDERHGRCGTHEGNDQNLADGPPGEEAGGEEEADEALSD